MTVRNRKKGVKMVTVPLINKRLERRTKENHGTTWKRNILKKTQTRHVQAECQERQYLVQSMQIFIGNVIEQRKGPEKRHRWSKT
jgi:hypothetical protein